MDIDSIFPSKYLKADELPRKKTTLTIKSVQVEDIGEDTKPVLIFREASKGLVLNKTKSMILKEAFGKDTDHWTGKQIAIYPTRVGFQGKMVASIGLEPVYPLETLETLPLAGAAVDLEFNDELPDFMK